MLKNLPNSEPSYAYKRYAYKRKNMYPKVLFARALAYYTFLSSFPGKIRIAKHKNNHCKTGRISQHAWALSELLMVVAK